MCLFFNRGEVSHQVVLLKNNTEPFGACPGACILAHFGEILSIDFHRSNIGFIQPGKEGEQGGFSTTTWSKYGNFLTRICGHAQMLEHLHPMVALLVGFAYSVYF